MARMTRRSVLRSGLATILASGRAPAVRAETAAVHWLRWIDFVPASDALLKGPIAEACRKTLGIALTVETVNANDLRARIETAIRAGAGPDIVNMLNNWPHLYAGSLAAVDDVAEPLGKAQGGFYETARSAAHDGARWLAVPFNIVGIEIAYRKSWFDEIGYTEFPQTWEQYRAAGKRLKAKGRPIGQTLGHTFGDAPNFAYPYLWSFGGREIDSDGKTVVLDSAATRESVKFLTAFWQDACDEGGLAWDDTSNNRAFLSGAISATLNGASIYLEALRHPETYRSERGAPLKDDIRHAPLPRGLAGQFSYHQPFSDALMGYSKNQAAAKEFLRWITSKEVYETWFVSQQRYAIGSTLYWQGHPLWRQDAVMAPFRAAAASGRMMGYAGLPNAKAAEARARYVIVDMYAKAIRGMPPGDAVKWAHAELLKIYT
jgi:multiple sugar transport system substrate-binding protein